MAVLVLSMCNDTFTLYLPMMTVLLYIHDIQIKINVCVYSSQLHFTHTHTERESVICKRRPDGILKAGSGALLPLRPLRCVDTLCKEIGLAVLQ